MKRVFIFEDSILTPSSALLKASYNGGNIHFSEGCSNMQSKLEAVYNSEDEFYIFYDVPPNNSVAVDSYTNLCEELFIYGNVYVIPIICIEYYILKMFIKYNYGNFKKSIIDLVDNLVKDFNANGIIEMNKLPSDYIKASLERVYKHILDEQNAQCFRNHNRYDEHGNIIEDKVLGKFYKEDCDCERKYCRLNCTDSVSLKAERLYTSLPVFDVDNIEYRALLESYDIFTRDITIDEVLDNCQQLLDEICDVMSINHIKVLRFK